VTKNKLNRDSGLSFAVFNSMASFHSTSNSFYADPTLSWNPCYRYTVSGGGEVSWEHGEVPETDAYTAQRRFDGVPMGRTEFLRINRPSGVDGDDSEYLESDDMNPCWAVLLKVKFRMKNGEVRRYIGLRNEIQLLGMNGMDAAVARDAMLDQFRANPQIAAELVGATEHRYGFDYCEPYQHHVLGVRLCWHHFVARQKWDRAPDHLLGEASREELLEEELNEEEEEEANLSPPEEDDDGGPGRGCKLQYNIF
jgi:hypothetical protein